MAREPITIFSAKADPSGVIRLLRQLGFKPQIEGPDDNWRRVTIATGSLWSKRKLILTHDREYYSPPNWPKQLSGMRGYIGCFPDGPRKERALYLVQSFGFSLGTLFEPEWEEEGDLRLKIVEEVVEWLDGVIFTPSSLRDAQWRALWEANGSGDDDAVWPQQSEAPEPEARNPAGGDVPQESLDRRARSEAILEREGIRINRWLPAIEIEAETLHRPKEEVAWRALALMLVAIKGEGLEDEIVQRVASDYALMPHLSPDELAFIRNSAPEQTDRIQFSWRYEATWTLFWALGYVEELRKPTDQCDVSRAAAIMQERSAPAFIADARLRPMAEILDQADLIYRYHWAVVDARVNGAPSPTGLHPGVVKERHHALNWLIGYMDQDWDEVSTDT